MLVNLQLPKLIVAMAHCCLKLLHLHHLMHCHSLALHQVRLAQITPSLHRQVLPHAKNGTGLSSDFHLFVVHVFYVKVKMQCILGCILYNI